MVSTSMLAQEAESCVFDDGELPDPAEFYTSYIETPQPPPLEPIVFNLFFWKVNDSEGNYLNTNFTEENILEGVAHLNRTFNQFNIFFKYLGYDTFNSPLNVPLIKYEQNSSGVYVCNDYQLPDPHGYGMIRRCQINSFFTYVTNNNLKHPNAINVYAPYATENYRGAASYSRSSVIVKPQDFATYVSPHEIAHTFALQHTRSTSENVPRNPTHPDFNANVTADRVVQTAAINKFTGPNGTFPYVNTQTCIYTNDGTQVDSANIPYEPSYLDVSNIMSDCGPCMNQFPNFFPEQGHFMRNQILSYPSLFQPKQNTIASLYEPYKGEYYLSGPVTNDPPLFQPGFRYRFRECECDCPEPSPYEDTSFSIGSTNLLTIEPDETDFNSITHPNHSAIQIVFSPSLPSSYGQSIRKCYDNWNRAPIGGSLTKFNDGVFNTNVTVTPQDSTAINNPNLIQQLDPGLYKIEKNYEDGAVEENVIYKENEE